MLRVPHYIQYVVVVVVWEIAGGNLEVPILFVIDVVFVVVVFVVIAVVVWEVAG